MRCDVGRHTADVIFNFTLQCRSPALTNNQYSEYQLFLYQTISEHREQGMTFDAIAECLNKEGYKQLHQYDIRTRYLQKRLPYQSVVYFYIIKTIIYSTVTDFARLRGWSTSVPFSTAVKYAKI